MSKRVLETSSGEKCSGGFVTRKWHEMPYKTNTNISSTAHCPLKSCGQPSTHLTGKFGLSKRALETSSGEKCSGRFVTRKWYEMPYKTNTDISSRAHCPLKSCGQPWTHITGKLGLFKRFLETSSGEKCSGGFVIRNRVRLAVTRQTPTTHRERTVLSKVADRQDDFRRQPPKPP